ncbi:MAG: hypothetical protein J0665_18075 [Deltaproteobacteria bacterium]|nr:hypothetical protein [Deltaproteobacteria bacterium]
MAESTAIGQLVASALISAGVVSAVMGLIFKGYVTRIEAEVKSRRTWKEESVAELLGPLNMQFDRTKRAFKRWRTLNLFLEAKVVRVGNETIRDLLLNKGHLIPPELLEDAGKLIEHYDVWLEKFEKQRSSEKPNLETKFVFVGPDGFPFPTESEKKFTGKFKEYWGELYNND